MKSLSRVRLFATLWTVAHQAPPSIGFSRQEYWSGLPFPSPGDLPDPGIEPRSPALQADALTSEPPGKQRVQHNWMTSLSLTLSLHAKSLQSCLTLCDPLDYTLHGILQARILEWTAIPFSRGSSQPRDWTRVSHIVGRRFTIWATREV